MTDPFDVLIYGAGAVGSVLGWLFTRTGKYRVSVVCRSNYQKVKEYGFELHTQVWGDGHFVPYRVLRAGSSLECPSKSAYRYIVLANKIKTEHDWTQVANDLAGIVTDQTVLVSTQNGMGNESALRKSFPHAIIISMVCNLVCRQKSPGMIEQHTSIRPHTFHLGIYGRTSTADLAPAESAVLHSLTAIDPQFITIEDALVERWRKLVFNNAWNSMTAITGKDTHELFESPSAIELVRQLAQEACQIGAASGVKLDEMLPDDVVNLAKACDPIVTSTLYDVRRGRALELAPMAGYLVAEADRNKIPVPYTEYVYERLKQMNMSLVA